MSFASCDNDKATVEDGGRRETASSSRIAHCIDMDVECMVAS